MGIQQKPNKSLPGRQRANQMAKNMFSSPRRLLISSINLREPSTSGRRRSYSELKLCCCAGATGSGVLTFTLETQEKMKGGHMGTFLNDLLLSCTTTPRAPELHKVFISFPITFLLVLVLSQEF